MSETPLTPEQVQQAETNALHHSYVMRVLKGADELANDLAGGNLDETMSARIGRLAAAGNEFAKLLENALDLVQPQHCEKAEAGNLADAQKIEGIEQQALEPKPTPQSIDPTLQYAHPMSDAVYGAVPEEPDKQTLGDA